MRGERKRDRERQDERDKIKMDKRGKQMQNINGGGDKKYNTVQYTESAGVWSENGCFMHFYIV